MKRPSVILTAAASLLLVLGSGAPLPRDGGSTGQCEQTFHPFALSRTNVFWIGEDVGGDCHFSVISNVALKDSGAFRTHTVLKEFEDWAWMREAAIHLETRPSVSLDSTGQGWTTSDLAWRIRPPVFDSSLVADINEHLRDGSRGLSWHQEHGGRSSIQRPRFEGVEDSLLYASPPGLYANYGIQEALYFPAPAAAAYESYALVFTHQPIRAVGLDTMHGFLIFRLRKTS